MERISQRRARNSSIEVLKIFSILLIVINHVVQTLGTEGNQYISFSDYFINLSKVTDNYQYLLISMLRYSGNLGNTVFFVCSAWFLLNVTNANKKKVFIMLADIWVISVICLVVVSICQGTFRGSLILQSLFPTTFSNNWYLTCYVLFFIIHPFLNMVIEKMSQRQLFRTAFWGVLLYIIIPFSTRITNHLFKASASFFSSQLVFWIVLYFVIAYIKKYAPNFTGNRLYNLLLIVFGFIGNYGIIILTNIIGLKYYALLNTALQIWNQYYNPFLIMMVIGAFNVANNFHFESKIINYISSLSLYIYIIHENIMLRWFYRPAMWQYIYTNYGYAHILRWVFILVVIIFAFGLISSILYKQSVHKAVVRCCERLYPKISNIWMRFENKATAR